MRRRIRELTGAVVAFSGGVDSAVLAMVAAQELKDKMCAATAISPSVPSCVLETAEKFCLKNNIPHIIINTNEFDDPNYVKNPRNRCFYCKRSLYKSLAKLKEERGFKYIVEGTNASDLSGHRPGYRASLERKDVVTPLIDAKMEKKDVRRLARELYLDVADKPSGACLASRVPEGVFLSPELLKKIDDAEEAIRTFGVLQVRLRHHGDIARIEVLPKDLHVCIKNREEIINALRGLGYRFVTLDLKGYRTGGTAV